MALAHRHVHLRSHTIGVSIGAINGRGINILSVPNFCINLASSIGIRLRGLRGRGIDDIVVSLHDGNNKTLARTMSLSNLFVPTNPVIRIHSGGNGIHRSDSASKRIFCGNPLIMLISHFDTSTSRVFTTTVRSCNHTLIINRPAFNGNAIRRCHSLGHVCSRVLHPR